VVCDLIEGEGRANIGIFNVLDDVCATMSAVKVTIIVSL
jgi:myosin heavy subunit